MGIFGFVIAAGIVGLVISLIVSRASWKSHHEGIENLTRYKKTLNGNSSSNDIDSFIKFLGGFQGSYAGKYIKRGISYAVNKHWGGSDYIDVREIFFHAIAPNKNISVERKEEIRRYMIDSLGIRRMDMRPNYDKFMGKAVQSTQVGGLN